MLNKLFRNIYFSSAISYFISYFIFRQIFDAQSLFLDTDLSRTTQVTQGILHLSSIVVTILIAILIIYFGKEKKKNTPELIQYILLGSILFTCFIAILGYQTDLLNNATHYNLIIKNVIFCVFTAMDMIILTVTWGMINHVSDKNKNKLTYLFLSILLFIIANLSELARISSVNFLIKGTIFKDLRIVSMILIAIELTILWVFMSFWAKAEAFPAKNAERKADNIGFKKFPWIKTCFILAFVAEGMQNLYPYFFLNIAPDKKNEILSSVSTSPSLFLILIKPITILLLFSFTFFILKKKTWGSIAVFGVLFLAIIFPLSAMFIELVPDTYLHAFSLTEVSFSFVSAIILIPFIQFFYLFLPGADRYVTKLKTEVIGVTCIMFLLSFIIPIASKIFPDKIWVAISAGVAIMILLLLALYMVNSINQKFFKNKK